MLQYAFKEWAVICEALGEGRQAIILRKGGIDEDGGGFSVQHRQFWLYPTYVHQQTVGINEETRPLLESVEAALKKHPAAYPVVIMTSSDRGEGLAELRAVISDFAA